MREVIASYLEPEGDVNEEGRGFEAEDQWWTSSLRPKKGAKVRKRWSLSDMKSDVNIVEIGQFGGLHIYVSGIGPRVCTLRDIVHFISVTFSRLNVLYF